MLQKIKQNKFLLLLAVILAIGILVRIWDLPGTPAGYNQDEVSSAYESFALIQNGTDRWGNSWPAYFLSWGSGQNVLLSYLDIPVFVIGGISPFTIRLIPVLLSILTLPLMYLTVKKLFSRKVAVLATALTAFSPLFIITGRWGLESNILPFFFLAGIYTFVKAFEDKRWIIWAFVPWALTLYTYSVSLVYVPVFIALLLIIYRKKLGREPRRWLAAVLVFAFLALPLVLMLLKNYIIKSDLPFEHLLPFSIPLFTSDRISEVPAGGIRAALTWDWRFFISGFNDGSAINSFGSFPNLLSGYLILPVLLFAIIKLGFDRTLRRTVLPVWLSLLVAGVGILSLSLLTYINVNRANAIYAPLVILLAYGLLELFKFIRQYSSKYVYYPVLIISIVAWLLISAYFIQSYFKYYNGFSAKANYPGLGEATVAVTALSRQQIDGVTLPVYFSSQPELNYIFVLFYNRITPADFKANAVITDRVTVHSYKNIYFNSADLPKEAARIYFLEYKEPPVFCLDPEITSTYGDWVIGSCTRK